MKEPKKKRGPKAKPLNELATIRINHYHSTDEIKGAGGREKATEIAREAVKKASKKS